jgi:hypothetical protein
VKHLGPVRRALAATLVLVAALLAVPATAGAVTRPALLKPAKNAVVARGTRPTFVVRDRSSAARQYPLYIRISARKRVTRSGELRPTKIGTFSNMKRHAGGRHTFLPTLYTFPTYFLQRPGRYWWQVRRIQCGVTPGRCLVFSKIRSFVVR